MDMNTPPIEALKAEALGAQVPPCGPVGDEPARHEARRLLLHAAKDIEQAMAVLSTLGDADWAPDNNALTWDDTGPQSHYRPILRMVVRQRKLSAVQLCLISASGLMNIGQALLADQLAEVKALDQQQSWQRLAEDAKTAGRAAYRVVLTLADPGANPLADLTLLKPRPA